MAPVSEFKFACPNCSQHLQAKPEETGRTIECPSCFKKLTVPQAPTNGGGKLIITTSLAEPRRPLSNVAATPAEIGPGRPVSRGLRIYLIVALTAAVVAAVGFIALKRRDQAARSRQAAEEAEQGRMWTDKFDELELLDAPVAGELNGWEFKPTRAIWKDTKLLLRQDGGTPTALRLEITFPLKGGELVAGKTYRLRGDGAPFTSPLRVLWKDEQGLNQVRPCASGYLLWVRFDKVAKDKVAGRLHLCLPDPTHSWVAGEFTADVRTVVD